MKLIFTDQYANLFFLLNGLVIMFYIGASIKGKKRAMKFGNYSTLEKVAGKSFIRSHNLVLFIRLLALTAILIGISNPVLVKSAPSAESDYAMAIDSSTSMLAEDFEPSRFEAAKQLSADFISRLPEGAKVGVVSFAGNARVAQELTSDRQRAAGIVANLKVGDRAGTAIGDAVISSVSMLLATNSSRSVILVTDGRNNVGSSVNESIKFAVNNNATVNTIGIGSTNQSSRNFGFVDGENGSRTEFPNLNSDQLDRIANETGGKFIAVTNRTELRSALLAVSDSRSRQDISLYFILAGAVLLLLEWLIATTRFSVIP